MIRIERIIKDIPVIASQDDEIIIRLDRNELSKAGILMPDMIAAKLNDGRIEIVPNDENMRLEDIAASSRPKSFYDGSYKGYRVSLRLERHSEYEPLHISHPYQVYEFLKDLENEPREKVLSVMLDSSNKVVGVYESAKGGIDRAMLSPYEVFQPAYLANSKRIILAHNHPSGDPTPSAQDRDITSRIKQAADIMYMQLLDHIVIGDGSYTSFNEKGYL